MLVIKGLKCIYDTGKRGWALELMLSGEDEESTRRFEVDSAEDAELLIEAFEDSSSSSFDPATGEIVFAYEYADYDDFEDDEDEDEDEDDEYSEDEEDEEDEDVEPEEEEEEEEEKKAPASDKKSSRESDKKSKK